MLLTVVCPGNCGRGLSRWGCGGNVGCGVVDGGDGQGIVVEIIKKLDIDQL